MQTIEKRPRMIANGWIQAARLVLVIGFFIMGVLTFYTYNDEPPIPDVVKDARGQNLFSRADVMAGQGIFLSNGLMEYGSIFGHGAYLGPDFTAEYLHRAALASIDFYNRSNPDSASRRTVEDFKRNRYDQGSGTLVYTDAQVYAFERCRAYYGTFFGEPTTKFGLRPNAITDPEQIRKLVAFFSWTAWAASAERPGHTYSYTNNWPPESLVDNHATADAVVWSVLSLIALLGGTGLLPRTRLNDGRVWNAFRRPSTLLSALHHSRETLDRSSRTNQFLVSQPGSRLDGIRNSVSARHHPALPLHQRELL